MSSLSARVCFALGALGFVSAQFQFTNPNGSLADLSQTFTVGKTELVQWQAGWKGYGQAPDFADLFLASFNSDAYTDLIARKLSRYRRIYL